MSARTTIVAPYGDDLPERRRPFVPDPNRVVYPVDHVTSQRAALAKFQAETRIVVGGQLTERMLDQFCRLEDKIRARVHDEAQYTTASVALGTYLAAAIRVRDGYMDPDDQEGRWR